jgi:hypothetical protein
MKHGRRPGVVPGACPYKIAFRTYEAVMSAMSRVKDAERPYLGDCCGYWHMTRTTQDEYAQQIAAQGCTDSAKRGKLELSGPDYLKWLEAQHEAQGQARDNGEPRARGGDAGEAPQPRGGEPRLTPSPAEVARRLQARRGA